MRSAILATIAAASVSAAYNGPVYGFAAGPKNECNVNFKRGVRHPSTKNLAEYGWVLVRRVKRGSRWHPATDHALGSQKYGSYNKNHHTANKTFSTNFSGWNHAGKKYNDVLFTTGDMRVWLQTTRAAALN